MTTTSKKTYALPDVRNVTHGDCVGYMQAGCRLSVCVNKGIMKLAGSVQYGLTLMLSQSLFCQYITKSGTT